MGVVCMNVHIVYRNRRSTYRNCPHISYYLTLFEDCFPTHAHLVPKEFRGKNASDLLELELRMIVSHHVGAGTEPWSSVRATKALNC